MSLFNVVINGTGRVVDAPSKAAAKAWAKTEVLKSIEVKAVSLDDLKGLDLATVPQVEAKPAAPAVTAAE